MDKNQYYLARLAGMHILVFGSNRVKTGCGVRIIAFYPNENKGMTENVDTFSNGILIECCDDDKLVTCEECKKWIK